MNSKHRTLRMAHTVSNIESQSIDRYRLANAHRTATSARPSPRLKAIPVLRVDVESPARRPRLTPQRRTRRRCVSAATAAAPSKSSDVVSRPARSAAATTPLDPCMPERDKRGTLGLAGVPCLTSGERVHGGGGGSKGGIQRTTSVAALPIPLCLRRASLRGVDHDGDAGRYHRQTKTRTMRIGFMS